MQARNYRELPPPAALNDHIACLWVHVTGGEEANLQPRILPDGCADLIWIGQAAPVVVGPATRVDRPLLPPDTTIVGVRFRPAAAPGVLGLPAAELVDRAVPLRDLWPARTAGPFDRVTEEETAAARLAAAAAAVARHLAGYGVRRLDDRLVVEMAAALAGRPMSGIRQLACEAGMSERQLRRRFEAAVGYGPKRLQRILRFQRWLRLARTHDGPVGGLGLAGLASSAGYADQAHLTREVVRLAGIPPAALLAELGSAPPLVTFTTMADSYKTDASAACDAYERSPRKDVAIAWRDYRTREPRRHVSG